MLYIIIGGRKYMNIQETTKFLMKKYNITASKALGQNFLIDEDVINETIRMANITKEDLVIEIGPGLGTLTEKLLDASRRSGFGRTR